MALRIVNNLAAMNTQRWLGVSDAGMKKSLERLSSGYRINRAADDAAGLAISQAFRADIASFKVASRNASEAGALLQVAEGGMDQIGNMLTRLKELATQASSANVGNTEREKIDAEATALTTEIDRIANSTKYGSTALLDGNFGATTIGALDAYSAGDGVVGGNIVYDMAGTTTGLFCSGEVTAIGDTVAQGTYTVTVNSPATIITISGNGVIETYSGAFSTGGGSLTAAELNFTNLGITIVFTASLSAAMVSANTATSNTVTFERTGLTSYNVAGADTGTYTISDAGGSLTITHPDGTPIQAVEVPGAGETITFDLLNISFVIGATYEPTELDGTAITVTANTAATGNTFQIGSENHADSQIQIEIGGVSTSTLGIDTLDLSSTSGAQSALTTIDTAIGTLAGSRGDIGASMNRLSYATANLASTIENVQAAESVIRDVDMANEMTNFTKNQILLQAGTAMLAQANMAPQQVLALFG